MTFGKNLLDLIEVWTAFIFIMLLLSTLVTSLVHATQAAIFLRARNLRKGVEGFLNSIFGEEIPITKSKAKEILKSSNIEILKGTPISHISSKELPEAIKLTGLKLSTEQKKKLKIGIKDLWKNLEMQMEKRFIFWIRIITFIWAVIIAFYFQLSTPNLLSKLSLDQNLRSEIVSVANEKINNISKNLKTSSIYEEVSEEALEQLALNYPNYRNQLEELSGQGLNKNSIMNEFQIVMKGKAKNFLIMKKFYEEKLDSLFKEKEKKYIEEADKLVGQLGRFSITPMKHGFSLSFYISNLIGLLITAILLSFGAPFWYMRLAEMLKLGDILKPKNGSKDKEKLKNSEKKKDKSKRRK